MKSEIEKEIKRLWSNIKSWVEANDPTFTKKQPDWDIDSCFGPPASDNDIAMLEDKIGMKLPDDLVASYKLFNGVDRILEMGDLLSLEEIYRGWEELNIVLKESFSYTDYKTYLNEYGFETEPDFEGESDIAKQIPGWFKWINIIDADGHTLWYSDLDPEKNGKIGQIICLHDFERLTVEASSFLEFLRNYWSDLEQGKYHYTTNACLTRR